MPKPLLPLFLDLDGRHALVLGDGEAADRRAASLRACGALVRHEPAAFEPSMLDGCAIAVGAEAPDPMLLAMTQEARRRGIPFNVVDRPSLSGYSTPAVVSRAPLQIAIASGGAAPVLARLLRARIEALVPPGFGRLASLADRMQPETRRRLPDVLRRRRMLEAAFSGRVAELMLAGQDAEAEAAYIEALTAAEDGARHPEQGIVYLVDPG
ncbi:MAG: precorrin-2 dehydrogenase/sirohydrochlorin ferrochelatase family protein, partial [Janthinobacterium lividum]